jgi:hypothetical protein
MILRHQPDDQIMAVPHFLTTLHKRRQQTGAVQAKRIWRGLYPGGLSGRRIPDHWVKNGSFINRICEVENNMQHLINQT